MDHFLSAVILVVFIMLFIGGLMMFYTVCVCVYVCVNPIINCTDENVSVCLSSVHGGVCPRSLCVSGYMPV